MFSLPRAYPGFHLNQEYFQVNTCTCIYMCVFLTERDIIYCFVTRFFQLTISILLGQQVCPLASPLNYVLCAMIPTSAGPVFSPAFSQNLAVFFTIAAYL